MHIKIHRGCQQIGGNIIEIGTENTKIAFDIGSNLPPLTEEELPKNDVRVEGLTTGKADFSAVFISHHHADHCGLVNEVLPSIPIFAGEVTAHILRVIATCINKPIKNSLLNFKALEPITFNDISVTPILTEHSAKDSYMFLIKGDGKTILYTGDFRNANSVRDILKGETIDVLITEGTNVFAANRNYTKKLKTEADIKKELLEISEKYDGTMFVLCSSTNEDRIFTVEEVGEKTGRSVFYDYFVRALRNESGKVQKHSFVANKVKEEKNPYFQKMRSAKELVGVKSLMKIYPNEKKILFVRQSMRKFIEKYLSAPANKGKNHVLVYSLWNGYKEAKYTADFLSFIAENTIDIVDCHCSGHAYQEDIKDLIYITNPKTVVPIHCAKDDREVFQTLHAHCNMLQDGEVFTIS